MSASDPLSSTPPETVKLWGSYAKDRFDWASDRIDELRNWSRQLSAAIAVVIGFELGAVAKVLDLNPVANTSLRIASLIFLSVAVLWQVILLQRALWTGYIADSDVLGPERPSVLANFVLGKRPEETQQMIAAYYANAFDSFSPVHGDLNLRVARSTRAFVRSFWLALVGFVVFVVLALLPPSTKGYNHPIMTEPAKISVPPVPSKQEPSRPPQASPMNPPPAPASNPLLKQPTQGEFLKKSDDGTGVVHRG